MKALQTNNASNLKIKQHRFAEILLKIFIWACALLTVSFVVGIIIYILVKGIEGMSWNFISTPAAAYPVENYGILGNIVNTLYLIVITLVIATPIGVGAAIYLTEYAKQGRLTKIIEFTTETLSGIPSIIYGLFGSVFFYSVFKLNYSILAGSLTLAIMILPIIIRTTQESIKTVPIMYREGAMGLGATRWYMIRTVILPCSIEGILTSVILSIGRIVGESAALIFTAGLAYNLPNITGIGDIFKKAMDQGASLTVQLYQYAARGGEEMKYAFSTALVLVIVVLIINVLTKIIARGFKKVK